MSAVTRARKEHARLAKTSPMINKGKTSAATGTVALPVFARGGGARVTQDSGPVGSSQAKTLSHRAN